MLCFVAWWAKNVVLQQFWLKSLLLLAPAMNKAATNTCKMFQFVPVFREGVAFVPPNWGAGIKKQAVVISISVRPCTPTYLTNCLPVSNKKKMCQDILMKCLRNRFYL
jgi:hypothetical protein